METEFRGTACSVWIGPERPTALIGERINPTGRKALAERLRMQESDGETLDDLGPVEIFERRLSVSGISEPQRRELRAAYKEILLDLERHDAQDESER